MAKGKNAEWTSETQYVEIRCAAEAGRILTVEIHVPGVIAVLVLPDCLADGANEGDGQ